MDMAKQSMSVEFKDGTVKCLLKEIQAQIDKIVFIHANPTQYTEIKKAIGKDMRKTSIESARIIEKSIERMDKVNALLSPAQEKAGVAGCLRSQLQDVCKRRAGAFDEGRCCALLASSRVETILSHRKAAIKGKGKSLSYEFRERLIGFVQKRGGILWENERIDELVKSFMKE
ncbi:hypothetical protein HK407_07g12210 [Ordospora pajunii]|uniref:uncharacterized protein n=1 Tax=Ordospora pajunii TaxID=3039483 RepID=UPI0029526106|nr:uncharacterized protein HK407_07g12210 [Ordospora pajunii]KAH9411228.1 hypothetical protein HK407_07g12210 [Ordospora pajunii]